MSIRHEGKIIAGFGGGGNGESISNQNPSSDIAQVYNWVGTYAEYIDQDIEVLHPDWVCYIIDDELGDEQDYQIIQYTARNVGDIFYTSRKDSFLNGAVECDGNTYSIHDFAGPDSIGNLLKANKIPYVSMTQYSVILTEKGNIGVFGWDGGENTLFRVPYLKDIFLEAGKANELGNYIAAGLPNITGSVSAARQKYDAFPDVKTGVFSDSTINSQTSGFSSDRNNTGEVLINFNASSSSSIYGNSSTVQPAAVRYRPMIQLSTGFNDTAIENCNSVKADVEVIKNSSANCLTEIPQDIKLQLTEGDVTLKAGSKLYIPNGFESDGVTKHFDKYTLTQDIIRYIDAAVPSTTATDRLFVAYQPDENKLIIANLAETTSGTGAIPEYSSVGYTLYYKTDTNKLYFITTQGAKEVSLPVGVIDRLATANVDYKFTKLENIFNGIGFVGSVLFVLPGVKGLIPQGKNLDGTNNNKNFTINRLITFTHNDWTSTFHHPKLMIRLSDTELLSYTGDVDYDYETNYNYLVEYFKNYAYIRNVCISGYIGVKEGRIIRLWPVATTEIPNYNNNVFIIRSIQPTPENSYTWYRIYSDGWVEQGGINTTSAAGSVTVPISLPITMNDTNYTINITKRTNDTGASYYYGVRVNQSSITTSGFNVLPDSSGGFCWEVKGIAAL